MKVSETPGYTTILHLLSEGDHTVLRVEDKIVVWELLHTKKKTFSFSRVEISKYLNTAVGQWEEKPGSCLGNEILQVGGKNKFKSLLAREWNFAAPTE